MRRYPSRYSTGLTYGFGPGGLTPAVRMLIYANVAAFVLTLFVPSLTVYFGLMPMAVVEHLWIWQPVTYMFLHGGLFHLLFNMLALWMFGVELERLWGTEAFLRYYAVTAVGAGVTTVAVSLLPFELSRELYLSVTIGASGAIYGLLLAYGLIYPDRPIYMYLVFPIPAKVFVVIIGAIAFLSSIRGGGGIAHWAHLGGLVWGYLYLKRGRGGVMAEIKYRYLKWKMNRLRRRFSVYSGSGERRDSWDRRIH